MIKSRHASMIVFILMIAILVCANRVVDQKGIALAIESKQTETTLLVSRFTEGGATTLVSVFDNGEPFIPTALAALSANGRYVSMVAYGSNIEEGDENGVADVYVYDSLTLETELVSVALDKKAPAQGAQTRYAPLSADGRYVAYSSNSSDIVSDDTNGTTDVFVYDRDQGITERISVSSNGEEADNNSFVPAMSHDGRYVAFMTNATNLDSGDTNQDRDVYVHDRSTKETKRISYPVDADKGGGTLEAMSGNGQYIMFTARYNAIMDDVERALFIHDQFENRTSVALYDMDGNPVWGFCGGDNVWQQYCMSTSGRYYVFSSENERIVEGDTNGMEDVFLVDRDPDEGFVKRISLSSNGAQNEHFSRFPAISADGQHVTFETYGKLVPEDTNESSDIYVYHVQSDSIELISVTPAGESGNSRSNYSHLSADGQKVVFWSQASDLVAGDYNSRESIFLRTSGGGTIPLHIPLVDPINNSDDDGSFVVRWSNVVNASQYELHEIGISGTSQQIYVGPSRSYTVTDKGYSTWCYKVRALGPNGSQSEWSTLRCLPEKLSGRVVHRNGSPIAGVTVSVGPEQETLTQSDGTFELILPPRVYPVTVAKAGYSFTPASQTIELTQDTVLGDFIGVADGGPVEPFLDLPFAYSGEPLEVFRNATKGWHEDGGQVWSWYDHNLPNYVKNDMLWRYFDKHEHGAWIGGLYTVGGIFYDGHDAYDFVSSANLTLSEIRAAADGRVVSIKEGCVAGDKACGLRHGNHVVIDHENGYFTLYSHLSSVAENISTVPPNNTVLQGQTLGIIGWTGNTTGVHLHFAVYRDSPQSPGWNGIRSETPVDPFGWSLPEPDPWVTTGDGPVSTYLWKHNIADTSKSTGDEGTTLTSATGDVEVFVPIEVLQGDFSATIFPISTDRIQADLRSSGYSFLLKLEHYSPATYGQHVKLSSQVGGSSSAISISIDYSDSSLRHLDESLLTVFQRKAGESAWTPLDTTIQIDSKVATAETNSFGTFSLQAPLLCPEDETEPDDFMLAAPEVTIGAKYKRWIDSAGDEDWFIFDVDAGQEVLFETSELGPGVNTIIGVYDGSANLLVSDNDSGLGGGSRINWQAPNAGTYFLKVIPDKISSVGCEATYTLTVQGGSTEMFSIFMPSILKTQ